jgi:hypothetical protein
MRQQIVIIVIAMILIINNNTIFFIFFATSGCCFCFFFLPSSPDGWAEQAVSMMMQRIEEGALAKIFDFVLGISLLLASKKAAHSSCWWMIVQPIYWMIV